MRLLRIEIDGFRNVVARWVIEPGGKSFRLSGENGAGKSNVVHALDALFGAPVTDGDIRDGEEGFTLRGLVEHGEQRLVFQRVKRRGKTPVLEIRPAPPPGGRKPGEPLKSPASVAAQFRTAIASNAFSQLTAEQRTAVVMRMAPGLDVSGFAAREKEVVEKRRLVGRDRDDYDAQARGVVLPDAPAEVGEERKISALVKARDEASEVLDGRMDAVESLARRSVKLAENTAQLHALAVDVDRATERIPAVREEDAHYKATQGGIAESDRVVTSARDEVVALERQLIAAREKWLAAEGRARAARARANELVDPRLDVAVATPDRLRAEHETLRAQLVEEERAIKDQRARIEAMPDPDLAAIDEEIRTAEEHNTAVRRQAGAVAARQSAEFERDRLAAKALVCAAQWTEYSHILDEIAAERTAQVATAKCPVEGLAIVDGAVHYPDGHGRAMPVDKLSTGEAITLDVMIASAMKLDFIPVDGWNEVDRKNRERIHALAEKLGIQLALCVTTMDGPLTFAIENGADVEEATT